MSEVLNGSNYVMDSGTFMVARGLWIGFEVGPDEDAVKNDQSSGG